MINPTTYDRPKTIDEALHKLNRPDAIALAGGGLTLRGVLLPYATVIDFQDLIDYRGVRYASTHLVLGGNASLQDVFISDYIMPRLRDSFARLLPINQRTGISVHESICAKDAPIEWLTALLAVGATVDHVGFEKGKLSENARTSQALSEFLVDVAYFGLPYAGFVKQVHVPISSGASALGLAHIARTPRDLPIVNAATFVELDDDRRTLKQATILLAGVHRKHHILALDADALMQGAFDESSINRYAESVPAQTLPQGDYLGSEAYRRAMSTVVVRRALLDALAQITR